MYPESDVNVSGEWCQRINEWCQSIIILKRFFSKKNFSWFNILITSSNVAIERFFSKKNISSWSRLLSRLILYCTACHSEYSTRLKSDFMINVLLTTFLVFFSSSNIILQKILVIDDIICVSIYIIIDIIMFSFTEYYMNASNDIRDIVHFLCSQISRTFCDFVSSIFQVDHFTDLVKNFFMTRTFYVQKNVTINQWSVFFVAKFRVLNDYNTQNLFDRFVFKRNWWINLIREIFLYSDIITSSHIDSILSARFASHLFLY